VWVCEGEKDTTTLCRLGLLAVTNPGGAGKWTADFTSEQIPRWFKGRQTVYVLEDNDPPGHLHAEQVASSLHGLVAEIRIVGFREMPAHGDVSDWLALGRNKAELVARAQAAPRYDAVEFYVTDTLQLMEFEPIRFVVPGLIAEGLTLFAGKPKIGKSWLVLHAACAVAAGKTTLGDIQCEPGDVFYAALEDNKRRLQRRMRALFGTDPWPRLYVVHEMKKLADGGLAQIKRWVGEVPRPRLVIIDTLKMVRSAASRNQSYYEADYESVKELRDLAAAHNIAIVVVHHLRKAEAEDPFDTVSGTLGLTGAVDTIMLLKREGAGIILAAKGRDVEEIVKAVEFDRETCTWTRRAGRSRQRADRPEPNRSSDRHEGGQCPPAAREAQGRRPGRAAPLREMGADRRRGVCGRGHPNRRRGIAQPVAAAPGEVFTAADGSALYR
jgi:hypothetical protein